MNYISTRGTAPVLNFEDTMLTGLARDGGLYVPEEVPVLAPEVVEKLHWEDYEGMAFHVMKPFIGDTFTDDEFKAIIARAYADFGHAARAPVKQLRHGLWMMELFHGPTLAFKDFAMQLIGQMFQAVLARRGERITIVGATSGDTGSAAIEAFRGLDNVDVCILFPHGRVSEVQRRQMTTPSEANVHALAVEGTFDDCQRHLKDMFADDAFRDEVRLAAVNSINWARVLAQVVYYWWAAVALGDGKRRMSFTVPTGNFGDIYAGFIAKRMGLDIERLVVATNQNDILRRAIMTGRYEVGEVRPSISPSMDIQVSSNFERLLFDALGRDGAAVSGLMNGLRQSGGFTIPDAAQDYIRRHFDASSTSEEQTSAEIAESHAQFGELVCPHSAIGIEVARAHQNISVPMVALATAHPAKFPDAVEQATGIRPPLPPRMADLFDRAERVTRVANDLGQIQALIEERRRK
ncbi:threonine synthase [Marimonas arenosa]|uniref:Threonine synthase n=1 Tax=Marimonas arenosa TaxID=1795305 RepID=A0AAE3WF03_9RHOB|nr:threonine synthase [Marimonas arenosa]MDQ2092056.1 threonine synthase [Marimonas arenosa]